MLLATRKSRRKLLVLVSMLPKTVAAAHEESSKSASDQRAVLVRLAFTLELVRKIAGANTALEAGIIFATSGDPPEPSIASTLVPFRKFPATSVTVTSGHVFAFSSRSPVATSWPLRYARICSGPAT